MLRCTRTEFAVSLIIAILVPLAGCGGGGDSPSVISEKAKNLGVYAHNKNGVTELLTFGQERDQDLFYGGLTTSFAFSGAIPESSSPVGFIVNLPEARISESKLFLLPNPAAAQWRSVEHGVPNPKPIQSTIEPVSGAIYKVMPSSTLKLSSGFQCLWIKMPPGTPDRMYCVKFSVSQSLRLPRGNRSLASPAQANQAGADIFTLGLPEALASIGTVNGNNCQNVLILADIFLETR